MTLPHPFRAASYAPELGLISCPYLSEFKTFPQHYAPSLQVSAEMVLVNALMAIKSASNEKSRKTATVKFTTWPLLLWQDDL